jgi:hypothetical protein
MSNAAAADAAREARAEVEAEAAPPTASSKAGAKPVAVKAGWHTFDARVWITDFNPVEFGVYKQSRNRAKSRQFTTDMDIFAEITENGERTGLLGYREDLWKGKSGAPTPKGLDRRIVCKLFTENLTWRATMDLMLGRSLQQTVGARGLPVTAWSINTNDDDFLIYVERTSNKWPLLPENFSFFLMTDGKPAFYRLRSNLINIAGDYTLYDGTGRRIGDIDGSIITLGGHWRGRLKADAFDKRLYTVMKMFTAIIVFNRGSRKHVRRLFAELQAGRLPLKLERQENDLYMNPRRTR